ncbi:MULTISPECIES: hypothetical protein [Actinosynnema]|uniref:hypothetical protein n=1 Tax=Actinosynnema TaxID=40566 RepID=UPI0020A3CBE2|nr:hypothetical protein [Actinosynnema pretiosum]MCP2095057.1 hypothetical protein [Actinosynnema pretiosum]
MGTTGPPLDRVGRALAGVNALLALGAFGAGALALGDVPDDHLVVESWRATGFLVFAGLWAVLAAHPRRTPALWELVLVHKVALTAVALTVAHTGEGIGAALVDGWLAVSTAVAYAACRGWRAWRPAGVATAL